MSPLRSTNADEAAQMWSSTLARRREGDGRPDEASGPSLQSILRMIEDQGQVGFWWHDIATDEITASPGLALISGVPTVNRRTRDSFFQAMHPQDRPFQGDLSALVGLGQPLRREFRIVRPDGTVRWVSCKIDVAVGPEGRPARIMGVVVDITERREAQRAVEYCLARRAAFLTATGGVGWLAGPHGEPVDVADWCALTGMDGAACAGAGWTEAVHPDDREGVLTAYRDALSRGTAYEVECRVRLADGTYRWFSARGVPVRDSSGAILEWQGVLTPLAVRRDREGEPAAQAEGAPLTGAQIRGARGLLDWSLAQLASRSGVSVSTIKRMEDGSEGSTRASKSDAVRRALEAAGVSFRTVDGVTWLSL